MRDARILLTSGSDDLATILTCGVAGASVGALTGRGEKVSSVWAGESGKTTGDPS